MKRVFCLLLLLLSTAASSSCDRHTGFDRSCVEKLPRRIVSTSSNLTEFVHAAGAGQYLVGVDSYSDTSTLSKGVVKIGSYPEMNPEVLLALKPDLILVWQQMMPEEFIRKLESFDLKVLPVRLQSIDDVPPALREIGRHVGTEQIANQNADRFLAESKALKESYYQQTPVNVFYEMWNQPLMTVGRSHFVHEAILLCGGQNIFADLEKGVAPVNLETVVARNPELIVTRDRFGKEPGAADNWGSLTTLSAVKNNNVIRLPDNELFMPAPTMLAGIRALCRHIQSVRAAESHHTTSNTSSNSLK